MSAVTPPSPQLWQQLAPGRPVVGGVNSFNNPGVKCHCEQLGAPLSWWAGLGCNCYFLSPSPAQPSPAQPSQRCVTKQWCRQWRGCSCPVVDEKTEEEDWFLTPDQDTSVILVTRHPPHLWESYISYH